MLLRPPPAFIAAEVPPCIRCARRRAASACVSTHRSRRPHSVGAALLTVVGAVGTPGGGVLDKPSIEQAPVKQKSAKLSPNYKVLLHNDDVNKREYVVRVLLKVIDGLTLDQAYDIMQEADAFGVALVIVTTQEQAENYCNSLRANGLVSTVEPDSGGRGGGKGE